jgi:hypothetical protein
LSVERRGALSPVIASASEPILGGDAGGAALDCFAGARNDEYSPRSTLNAKRPTIPHAATPQRTLTLATLNISVCAIQLAIKKYLVPKTANSIALPAINLEAAVDRLFTFTKPHEH